MCFCFSYDLNGIDVACIRELDEAVYVCTRMKQSARIREFMYVWPDGSSRDPRVVDLSTGV